MSEERKFSISEIEEILNKVVTTVISTVELASTVASTEDTPKSLTNAVVQINRETANEVKNQTLLLLKSKITAEDSKNDIKSILKSLLF